MAKANCRGKTKTGAACRAPAAADGLCFFHAHPESAKTLGRLGGQRNRRSVAVDLAVPENMNLTDLRKLNAEAMRLLLSGELHAREAAAFAQLSNSQLRVIHSAELETRVATLETQVRREQGRASSPPREFADEAQVSVDSVDPAPGAIAPADSLLAVEPMGGGNSDLAAQADHRNATDAKAPICADNEERGEAEQ
jgi:hypothetical protein